MNILVVSHTFPYPPNEGIKLPLYNLIKEFSKTHEVSLLSFVNIEEEKYISEIKKYVKKMFVVKHFPSKNFFKRSFSVFFSKQPYCVEQFFSKIFTDKLDEMLSSATYDVIFFDFINTVIYEKFIREKYNVKKILFLHDAMSMLFYRNFLVSKNILKKYYWFNQYIKLLNFEFELQNSFDKIVVVSQKDKNWLVKKSNIVSEKIEVIPNGVDINYFKTDDINFEQMKEENLSLIFRGIMNFPPNEDACIYFLTKIFPLVRKLIPEIKFYIVGPNPSHKILNIVKNDKNIIVTGYVEDIRKYISLSIVNVCPMISGSGIKNKILEPMSMGKPSVATSIAIEGIPELKNFENILVSDEPQDFAKKIVLLIKDKDLYKKISINGRKLIEEKYNWKNIANKFLQLF